MEQIIVTHVGGSTVKLQSKENGSTITKAVQNVQLLGADTVDITVESVKKLTFAIGDKITVIGRDYTLNTPARERKVSDVRFVYDLQFEGVQYDLLRASYSVNVDTTSSQIQDISGDSLTGDLKRFMEVLVANANRVFPGKWLLGEYPPITETRTETFSDTDNCLSVLQSLCSPDKYNTEFYIGIDANGIRTLNVGEVGKVFTYSFQYGKGKGLYELTREKVSSANIITRLNAYGSSKNIVTSRYKMPDGTFRGLRLCLPTKKKGTSFIEDAAAIALYGVWENTKNFEDIYPHRTGTVSALGANHLTFIDSSMNFDLNEVDGSGNTLHLIPGVTAKIHFNTGNLAGYEFELLSYDHDAKLFTIIQQEDENGYKFPSETTAAYKIGIGDEYVITDIFLPQSYIDTAEAALATAAQNYLDQYKKPLVQYSLVVDKFFLRDIVGEDIESNIIWIGDYIPIVDTDLGVDATIRVKGFTRDLIDQYVYNLTISDMTTTVSTITRVISELNDVDKIVKINNLNDPARARRNWKTTSELVTMLDTLQAEAALIGNDPAAQYTMSEALFSANYNGDANSIHATAAVLAHAYYPEGNPGTWNITEGNFSSLTPATPYYLYVKASKSANSAIYVLSSTKIAVESVVGFYHFPVGILSSVVDGRRVFQTTKGYTLITGDEIKTGKISSQDGNTYFDLTNGEFMGVFKFTNGNTIESEIAASANNIKVGGKNLVLASLGTYTGTGPLHFYNLSEPLIEGVTYSVSVKGDAGAGTNFNVWVNKNNQPVLNLTGSGVAQGTFVFGGGAYPSQISVYSEVSSNPSTVYWVKIEKGNKPTDWTPAPEDVPSAMQYLASALTGSTDISGGLLATNVLLMKTLAGIITGGMSGLASDNIGVWAGGTYQQAIDSLARIILRKDGSGQLAAGKISWNEFGRMLLGNFDIEGGAIIGYADDKNKIKLHTGAVETLTSLLNGVVTNDPTLYSVYAEEIFQNTTGAPYGYDLTVSSFGVLTVPASTTITLHYPTVSINVLSGTVTSTNKFYRIRLGNTLIGEYTGSTVVLTAGGTYTIEYVADYNILIGNGQTCTMIVSTSSAGFISYQLTTERSEIGKNGLFSFWSQTLYFYFSQLEGLKYKGLMDIPGVLASGTIGSAGAHTNSWGAKKSTSNATYTATGIYDVPHAVGSTAFQLSIMPSGDGQNAFMISKSSTSFRVQIRNNSGVAASGGFDYVIFGNN